MSQAESGTFRQNHAIASRRVEDFQAESLHVRALSGKIRHVQAFSGTFRAMISHDPS